MGIPHLAFDFSLRSKCGNRVYNDDVNSSRSYKVLCNVQSLFTCVRLRNPKIVYINTEIFCINRVKCVFRVNKSRDAAVLLRLCNCVQSQCSLTRRFRTINFDNTSARITADTKSLVKQNRAWRNHLDSGGICSCTEFHKRALTELLFNLKPCSFQSLHFFRLICRIDCFISHFCHLSSHTIQSGAN